MSENGRQGLGIACLDDLVEAALDFAKASKADNTRRAYDRDWRDFAGWCDAVRSSTQPASVRA